MSLQLPLVFFYLFLLVFSQMTIFIQPFPSSFSAQIYLNTYINDFCKHNPTTGGHNPVYP